MIAMRLRLEFQHGFGATGTNGRMLGVFANVSFPMPAALAFLAVGMQNFNRKSFSARIDVVQFFVAEYSFCFLRNWRTVRLPN